MAYTINDTLIDLDRLVCNVTIHLDAKTDLVCTVPVVYPKSEAEVIAAIEQREKNEAIKFDSAPVLVAVKTELDKRIGVKTATASDAKVG